MKMNLELLYAVAYMSKHKELTDSDNKIWPSEMVKLCEEHAETVVKNYSLFKKFDW